MNKLRNIRRENTAFEKQIEQENQDLYTDMIVYLRSSNINDYHQELIRQDIASMVVEGQSRGESPQGMFGPDIKAFMDEVISSAPEMTTSESRIGKLMLGYLLVLIMAFIYLVRDVLVYLNSPEVTTATTRITLIDLLSLIVIGSASVLVVDWIAKTALSDTPRSDKRPPMAFIAIVILVVLLLTGLLVLNVYFDGQPTLRVPLIPYAILLGILSLGYLALRAWMQRRYYTEL